MHNSLLIVEDDRHLASTLFSTLKSETRQISLADTVESAFQSLNQRKFDLVLLDRKLPDGDGLMIASHLKEQESASRILCLSQLGEVDERVTGLRSGVDDYLPKPFSLRELEFKIEKLLSLERRVDRAVLRAGEVSLLADSGEVRYDDRYITLRKKEAEILECLVRHKNNVMTREQIIDWVWPNQEVAPTQITLDVYIRRLRMLLGKHSSLIKTVRGYGYSLSDRG